MTMINMDAETTAAPEGDLETALGDGDHAAVRLWLRLLTCTSLVEREVRNNLRTEFSITLPRFDLMAQLDRAGKALTMGELSRRLMVSNGNVTGLIERLVQEGLVDRKPAPGDRRSHLVKLTRAGKKAFDAMTPVHEDWIEQMFAGLSEAETRQLYDLLARLKASLGEALEDSDKDTKS